MMGVVLAAPSDRKSETSDRHSELASSDLYPLFANTEFRSEQNVSPNGSGYLVPILIVVLLIEDIV